MSGAKLISCAFTLFYGLLRFQNAEFSSFWWVFNFLIHRKNILIHENAVLDWNLQRLDWEHYTYLKLDYFSGPYTHCDWLQFQMFMLLKVSLIAVIWNTHKQCGQYLACFFWHRCPHFHKATLPFSNIEYFFSLHKWSTCGKNWKCCSCVSCDIFVEQSGTSISWHFS